MRPGRHVGRVRLRAYRHRRYSEVEHAHLMTVVEQRVHDMRADEPAPPVTRTRMASIAIHMGLMATPRALNP